MLFGYFISKGTEGGLTFSNFASELSTKFDLSNLDVSMALRCIRNHYLAEAWLTSPVKPSGQSTDSSDQAPVLSPTAADLRVFMFLDETAAASQPASICSNIGAAQNVNPWFYCLISTLDQTKLQESNQTASQRPICWIPLTPIDSKLVDSLQRYTSPSILWCIADCGGHPRSLEILVIALQQLMHQDVKEVELSFQQIWGTFLALFSRQYRDAVAAVSWESVKPAIMAIAVDPEAKVIASKTYLNLVSDGLYCNSMEDNETKLMGFIPRMTGVFLRIFATSPPLFNEDNWTKSARGHLGAMLDHDNGLNWQRFEEYHGHWEALMRCCYGNSADVSLAQHYRLDENKELRRDNSADDSVARYWLGGTDEPNWLEETKWRQGAEPYQLTQLVNHFPGDPDQSTLQPTAIPPQWLTNNQVLMPAAGNTASDLVALHPRPRSSSSSSSNSSFGHVCINVQVKFSNVGQAGQIESAAVKKGRSKLLELYRPFMKASPESKKRKQSKKVDPLMKKRLAERDIIFVVVAHREKGLSKWDSIPERTILIPRRKLLSLYGPTLSSRPSLLVNSPEITALTPEDVAIDHREITDEESDQFHSKRNVRQRPQVNIESNKKKLKSNGS
jgi:hypothetical protein